MRALVKRAPGSAPRLEELPDPAPAPGEALIAVRAAGICGTDLHILDDVYPHAEPLIPGHEFAGEIVGIGAGVEDWQPGDRVVGELHTGACLSCETCRAGNPQICPVKRALGTWTDGAFAELMTIPAWLLHRIPAALSDAAATLIEPTACAWHAMFERTRMDPGDSVLIAGHGPLGLLSGHLATLRGARQVIVVGRSRHGAARLDSARELGFEVLDESTQDVRAVVAQLTDHRGVDLAVETAGSERALATCVHCCRPGGRVAVLGLSGSQTVPLAWDWALQRDLDLAFSFSSNSSSWESVIALADSTGLPFGSLVSHVLELERWADGFEAARSGNAVKVVLTP
ncbi:MAG TPA: alcohol dehydrogenase catalytic domain-containing protein [Solirubrobacteraceae bacterium]|nr:alcohol dehydrogenase catalytic domain-containing protein [Solirubrobacteraceae bacterium]